MRRVFIRLAVIASAVVTLGVLALSLSIYSLRKRQVSLAQNMMDDAARVEVGRSSLNDVLAYAHKYSAEATGSWQEPCTETDCLVVADAHQNDFTERHPKLGSLGTHISPRGWGFITLMWVKDGKLYEVQQWFWFSTPTTNASVITTTSQPGSKLCHNPFFRLHPTFAAYEGPKHFAVWVDSSANAEKGMLKLNLNCAASIRGCQSVPEMAPVAWAKYESDRPFIDSAKWAEAAQDDNCR